MPFTKRELSVLHLRSQGMSTVEISEQLGLAISTVDSFTHRIRHKLQGTGIKLEDLKNLSPEFLKELESLK